MSAPRRTTASAPETVAPIGDVITSASSLKGTVVGKGSGGGAGCGAAATSSATCEPSALTSSGAVAAVGSVPAVAESVFESASGWGEAPLPSAGWDVAATSSDPAAVAPSAAAGGDGDGGSGAEAPAVRAPSGATG